MKMKWTTPFRPISAEIGREAIRSTNPAHPLSEPCEANSYGLDHALRAIAARTDLTVDQRERAGTAAATEAAATRLRWND